MKDIQAALSKDDVVQARAMWDDLQRWDNLHMRMEEGKKGVAKGLFSILDEYADGIVTKKKLRHHHQSLYEYEEDITDAFANSCDVSESVKASFESFQKANLAHLEMEESVMMPALQRLSKEGQPMKTFMCRDVFPSIPKGEIEFFIKFANQVLVQHEDGMPRVRVFNHALWAAATKEQWSQWQVWIQESLSPEKFNETMNAIDAFQAYQKAEAESKSTTLTPDVVEPLETAVTISNVEDKPKRGRGIRGTLRKLWRGSNGSDSR